MRVQSIVSDLGLPLAEQNGWVTFLQSTTAAAQNEVVLRQLLYARLQQSKMDPNLRGVLLQRTLAYYRGLRKAMVQIYSVDELLKAEPRGGKYYRRVPHDSGKGHRYIYDPDKYHARKDAHVSGEDAAKAYVQKAVLAHIEQHGEKGCDVDSMKELAKKHGADKVAGVLKEHVQKGSLAFQKGVFRRAQVQKSRFVIRG